MHGEGDSSPLLRPMIDRRLLDSMRPEQDLIYFIKKIRNEGKGFALLLLATEVEQQGHNSDYDDQDHEDYEQHIAICTWSYTGCCVDLSRMCTLSYRVDRAYRIVVGLIVAQASVIVGEHVADGGEQGQCA
jgi:hypothetical protein